ncbi:MAG: exosortase T [Alphaproteobacteria bacterium]|nr:exosortase T [Alphaproteobacteria bacterium]
MQHVFSSRALSAPTVLLLLAGLVLAIDPAIWLVKSWLDPAYDSSGYLVFAITLGLFVWSASSPLKVRGENRHKQTAIALLILSALVRLASQILAINTIGALCLVVDVFALAILLRLPQRARPVSAFWLAAVFVFSLPLERIIQRTIGYGLQQMSADGACTVLSGFYSNLVCEGTRIVVNGVDVLVDLPCSGAQTLLLGLLGFCVAAAFCRAKPIAVVAGLTATVATACVANLLRIAVLAVGLAEPGKLGGINVMAQPWHDLIGLTALLLVCAVLAVWVRLVWRPTQVENPNWFALPPPRLPSPRWTLTGATCALLAALVITGLPRTALDVSAPAAAKALPIALTGHLKRSVQLTPRERAFFNQFGGWSAKAEYGPHGLMLVNTSSPLRHLHGPEDCLRGLGYEVEYLGAVFEPLPTAVYRAISPDGTRYRIDVSFVSAQGSVTTNVATAVWKWLQGEAGNWTAVQRISPEALAPEHHARFNTAVIAALDLSPNQKGTN